MEVEKRRTKGGFRQFFDWNGKSRKKLFSNSPDIPGADGVEQGTDDAEIVAKSRFQMEKGMTETWPSKYSSRNHSTSHSSNFNHASYPRVSGSLNTDSTGKMLLLRSCKKFALRRSHK